MKILIVCCFFPPQNAIASQRPYSWAKYWSRSGHDVTVLTPVKDHGKSDLMPLPFDGFKVIEVAPPRIFNWLRALLRPLVNESAAEITVNVTDKKSKSSPLARGLKSVLSRLRSKGLFSANRMPDAFDFWVRPAVKSIPEKNFDLIVSTHGPYASLLVGWRAKIRSPRAIWICDFRDLWTRNHVYPGIWPFILIERILERFLLRRCDFAVTVSEPLARQLRRDHPKLRVEVVENGVDLEELKGLLPDKVFRADGKKRIVYTGSFHAIQRNPSPILEAVSQLTPFQREHLELVFVGPGSEIIDADVERFGLEDHVIRMGSVRRRDALRMQRDADVLLFLEYAHEKEKDGVLTGKIFEYMASRRPIWAVGIGAESTIGQILEESKTGLAFGKDVVAIRSALEELLNNGAESVSVGQYIERFDRKVLAQKFLDLVSSP